MEHELSRIGIDGVGQFEQQNPPASKAAIESMPTIEIASSHVRYGQFYTRRNRYSSNRNMAHRTIPLVCHGGTTRLRSPRSRRISFVHVIQMVRNIENVALSANNARHSNPLMPSGRTSRLRSRRSRRISFERFAKLIKSFEEVGLSSYAPPFLAKIFTTVSLNQRAAQVSVIKAQATSSSGVRLSKEVFADSNSLLNNSKRIENLLQACTIVARKVVRRYPMQ
ncbi:hypothetical protein FRX31_015806 [Thalictrum thalictroides]|uniref:Uncharacterized protein n=1 Tax=Thalictrum thalictroides TaxID=46969 RepID=A0A7J6WE07_THATH|nr:hypothetical protein FRX31_015806 [Thalictrum thalictroides]